MSKQLGRAAGRAFAAGTHGGEPPTTRTKTEQPTQAERLGAQLAKTERERDQAREDVAKAECARKTTELAVSRDITDATQIRRVVNMTESERERCKKAGEAFDLRFAVAQAVHKVKTAAGQTSVAPVAANGRPGGKPVPTFAEIHAERERFRKRLRELGLDDPSTASIPGNGGVLGGCGPIGGK
jgi:hypothetical protein